MMRAFCITPPLNTHTQAGDPWRCLLKRLDNSTCNASVIIAACCTLYNICKVHSEEFDEAWRPSCDNDDDKDPADAVVNERARGHNRGAAIRNATTNTF